VVEVVDLVRQIQAGQELQDKVLQAEMEQVMLVEVVVELVLLVQMQVEPMVEQVV
jgi:hypothetical protein